MIRERRKLKHIPQKQANIESAVLNRIKVLYKQTVTRFPENIRVWDEYIQFCKIYKFRNEVSPIFDKMLQFHADKPETWLKAVMWEHAETKNKERVKHFILGGLQRHPKSQELYFAFIKLKLIEGADLKEEQNEARDKLISQAELIYKEGKTSIGSIEFVVGVLEIVSEFDFARSLEAIVLADMQANYRDSELMWHTLARRELKGKHLNAIASGEDGGATDPEKCIKLCITIYETACDLLASEQMFSYYLETVYELEGTPSITEEMHQTLIKKAFVAALDENKVSEENFLRIHEFSAENESFLSKDELLDIIQKATTQYPKSVALWEILMRFHIEYQQLDELALVFKSARKQLPVKETYPLWELLLLFYKSDDSLAKKVNVLFREGIALSVPEISNPLKPLFLEHLAQTEGITSARQEYNKLCLCVPSSLELHKQMARLEEIQVVPNVNGWRKCHEMATQFFGKDNVNVWLELINFEKRHGDAKKISQLYQRAMANLDPALVGDFITAYNLSVSQI